MNFICAIINLAKICMTMHDFAKSGGEKHVFQA